MKLTTLLFFTALVLTSSEGWSQITLKEKNAPLEKVLTAIEKQTQYVFLYNPDELKVGLVTIDVKNASLQQTLDAVFKDAPVAFTVIEHNVLLKNKPAANARAITDISIRGKVVDSTGQALPGVTVLDKRKRKATETDSTGAYTLKAAKGDLVRFSSVGYKDREIIIGDESLINVNLEVSPGSPDQVVVIGYGSSKKKDLTGAVSIVDLNDMSQIPYNTFDNALAGKAAGVDVTKTDGTPGGMVRVRIRGSSSLLGGNDPLYVIDGIPIQVRSNFINPGFSVPSASGSLVASSNSDLNGAALPASFVNGLNSLGGLNPDDIASITILKDASSTAIYGSKASNGVVIITTKTGKTNSPPQVTLSYYPTVNSPYKAPGLLNASQYKDLLSEAAQNALSDEITAGYTFFDPDLATILDTPGYFGNANTNWLKQVTHTIVSNNIGLSVSGGGQVSRYFSSLSYNSTPGVLDGTDYHRISGKLTLETQIASKFRLVTNLLFGFTNQNIGDGAYTQALLARPDWAPRDATGSYLNFPAQGYDYAFSALNPAALLTAINNGKTLSLLGSLSGIYAISNDLHFKSSVALNMQQYNQRNYLPSYINIQVLGENNTNPGGIGSEANSRFTDWFLENTLTYTKQFTIKHAVNVVVGQSYETTKYSYFTATASGYPNDNFLNGLSSADSVISVTGDDPVSPQAYLLSFYARANYSYLDKYLFTFTGRADGSSRFGPENKFGYFPSGALAWRMSREKFLNNIRWIDNIMLRGSYGLTGNQNIGDQMYRTLFSPSTYAGSSALIPTQFGNQGIKWESTKESDVGLDVSLLANRLNATFDYYNRQTSGALLSLPTAVSTGFSDLLQNAVGLRNRGFEASLGGDIVRAGKFKWTASINATWNSSLVTRLDPQADLSQIGSLSGIESIGGTNTTLAQGKPLGLLTGFFITGIIKTQAQLDAYTQQLGPYGMFTPPQQLGDPMFKLFPSGGFPDGGPAYGEIIGNGPPKYYGGMTQEFSYKKLDLKCYFTFSHGGHLLWAEHAATTEFFGQSNANVAMLNRYTPTNTNSNDPRLDLIYDEEYPTNLDVFSSSYLKLRSLILSYYLNVKKMSISNAQVFISATNVFTLTKYPVSDPEVSDDPYSVNGGYIDAGNYPAIKTFSLGFKAAF
jgi:TonB-dependent starch-binding outer membrane protein SusC